MRNHIFLLPRFIFLLLMLTGANFSHAVVINFDDIKRVHEDPESPSWADQPITDQYASKGLVIDGGWLNSYYEEDPNILSGPNYLQGGPYFGLKFTGHLPKFVSLIVTSSNRDAVYLNALCGDGSTQFRNTPGYAGSDDDPPFEPNQKISFYSALGISYIDISAFYFRRTSAMIDDLTYHYEIHEPGTLILFAIGLFALIWKRVRM